MAFYGGGVRQRRYVAGDSSTLEASTSPKAEPAQRSSPFLKQAHSGPMPVNPFASPPPPPFSPTKSADAVTLQNRSGKNPFAKPIDNTSASTPKSKNPFAKPEMPQLAPVQFPTAVNDKVEEVDLDALDVDGNGVPQLPSGGTARVVSAPTHDKVAGNTSAKRAALAVQPASPAALPGSNRGRALLAPPSSADAEKVKARIAAADTSACASALSAWDASLTSALHRRAPLADIALTGRVPLGASLDVWSRLAGRSKAATHGRSLEELLLLADGPGGVPAGDDGTFGGKADEESTMVVTPAVRHHIRKDLKRTRVVPEFEAAIDPNPEKGSLYRVLAAYACLDPHTGYVQGMNFIAALIVAPTVLAQQPQVSTAPTPASMPASADAGALKAVTTSTRTTAAAAVPSSSSFQGCPLSIEDERAAFELFVRLMQASGVRRVFDARDDYLHCLLLRLEFHVKGFLPYLHEHLDQEEVPYAIFAVEWFTTLFVYNFNFETSRAALSLFFVEGGMVFTVQLAIALLYKYQESLLALRFDTLVPWLKKQLQSLTVDELLGALQHLGSLRALQRESYAGLWDFTRPDVTVTQIAAAAMSRSGNNQSNVQNTSNGTGGKLIAEGNTNDSNHLEAVKVVVVQKLVAGQSYRVILPDGRSTTELFPVGAKVGDTLTLHMPRLSTKGRQGSSSSIVDDGVVVLADSSASENEGMLGTSNNVSLEAAEDVAWVASRLKRPRWMPDDEVLQCSNSECRRRFNKLAAVRRHHCRACGSVVCGACSRGKAALPLLGYDFSTLVRVCTPCLEAGAGAAATQEARERKAADPQVRAAAALAGLMDDENDEDSDYDFDDDSTGVVVRNNGSHHGIGGGGTIISEGKRRVLGYVCDLPTISFDILDDGTTTAAVADHEGTTSTPFDYASYMPLKFGIADLRRHLVLGRSNSGSKTKSLTDEVEEAHRFRRGKGRNKREKRRQSTADPLSGAIVYFYESILENDSSGLADLEGKTNADARATPLSMATEATQATVSDASTSHHSKNKDDPTRKAGDQDVALTLASALGAVLGYSSCPLSEPLKNQEQLNEESRQARAVVDDGAPLPPEAFTSRNSAIAGKSKSVPHINNTEPTPPSVPPPRSSPYLECDELDAHQHGLEYNEQSRDVADKQFDNEVGLNGTSAERTEPEESMAIIQARNMHREGAISADELSEVIARDRRFSAHFDLDEPGGGNACANADAVIDEATTRPNYELVEAEELAGGAFRALRVACGIQLSSFARSLGGGPLLALSRPEGNARSNGGSAVAANVFMSHDQMFVLKEVTPHEAALLLALLPDYIRHISANASHTLLPKFLGLFKVRFGQHFSSESSINGSSSRKRSSGPANLVVVLPNHLIGDMRPVELPTHVASPTPTNEASVAKSALPEFVPTKIASTPPPAPVQLKAVYDLKGSTRYVEDGSNESGNTEVVSNGLKFALLVARTNCSLPAPKISTSPLAVMMAERPPSMLCHENTSTTSAAASNFSRGMNSGCCVLHDLNFCPSHGPGLAALDLRERRSSVSGRRQSLVEADCESELGPIDESKSSAGNSLMRGSVSRESITGLHLRQRMRASASRLNLSRAGEDPSEFRLSMEEALSKGIDQRNQIISQPPTTPSLFQPPLPPPLPVVPPCRKFMLGAARRATFLANVRSDVAWLREHGLVDYSLLLGVGTCSAAAVKAEELAQLARKKRPGGNSSGSNGGVIEGELVSFWEGCYGGVCAPPPEHASQEQLEGAHKGSDMREWYTFGIVNILQRYDARSIAAEVETSSGSSVSTSSISNGGSPDDISAANPSLYAGRFVSFLERHTS